LLLVKVMPSPSNKPPSMLMAPPNNAAALLYISTSLKNTAALLARMPPPWLLAVLKVKLLSMMWSTGVCCVRPALGLQLPEATTAELLQPVI
jgi:hypothetical protein